jgi:phosphoenolpyruvate synthase/pyruvate phosphate dikinase
MPGFNISSGNSSGYVINLRDLTAGEAALLDACRGCFASLFTDPAITYRETHGFDHLKVARSVGGPQMVG